jgi:hypothetical protein
LLGQKMSEGDFNPYFKWLGIAPEHQPPDHYRLLGIPQFVEDPEVIEHAADQRMMLVKSFQTGQHSDWSQRLLLEVAKAKRCLLTAEAKANYDAVLRQKMAADAVAKTPPTVAPPLVGPAPPPPQSGSAPHSPPPPPPRSAPPQPPAGQAPPSVAKPPPTDGSSPRAENTNESRPAEESSASSFFGKALQAGRDIKAMAMSAARHTALLAEKRKIESLDLPQAFAALGREVVSSGRFRDELADDYRRVQRLAAQWREVESHDDEPHSFAEIAASAAERLKDVVATPGILTKLNAAYSELGAAAFAAFGEKSGSPGLVAPIVTHRCRLAELERELAADD